MTNEERQGQIEWFQDLRDAIKAGDTESALAAIDAEIKLLRRQDLQSLATEGDRRPGALSKH